MLCRRSINWLGVGVEVRVSQVDRLVNGQRAQRLGQIGRARHRGAAHQHGDDAHAALERLRNLEAHEVARRVEPASAVLARDRQPPFADDRQQDAALPDLLVDHRGEVVAALDVVEVHERLIVAEAAGEHVEQAAGVAAAVVAPVADEDSRHVGQAGQA